jgi:hypothetical protein
VPDLFLDPYLLAFPKDPSSVKQIEDYALLLETSLQLHSENWVTLYRLADQYSVLDEAGAYPEWDEVKQALLRLNIEHISPKDILSVAGYLLDRPVPLEDKLHLRDILLDDISCNPSQHLDSRPASFVDCYHRLSALACLVRRSEPLNEHAEVLITSGLDTDPLGTEVNVHVLECTFTQDATKFSLPCDAHGHFSCCATKHSVYLSLDPVAIWLACDNAQGYLKALEICIYQTAPVSGEATNSSWTLGRQFLQTASTLGFLKDPAKAEILLRACAETALSLKMPDTHALRTGRGGGDPQRKRGRDKAKAWRRDIDRQYHLHYWETPNGPEFASVVVHNDFAIPE